MKFHAYPKLLLAVGSLTLSALSGSAAFATDTSALAVKRSTSVVATDEGTKSGPAAQKTLLNLMGKPSSSNKAAVCGDSEPDVGEECDDGNTVGGDGCDATCTIEAGSDCTAAIAGMADENIIVDGSFEDNDPAWTLVGSAFSPRCGSLTCGDLTAFIDGEFYLWMAGGFLDNPQTATATQTLVIPSNATTLTFDYAVAASTGDCESPAEDRLELFIDGVSVFRTADPCVEVFPFVTEIIPLGAFADGGSHTIEFFGTNVEADPTILTTIWVDNVQLNVPANPPVPPVPSSCLVGVCGDGILSSGEICDDGNTTGGDGCSAACNVDVDFVCTDPLYNAFDFLPTSAAPTADAVTEGSLEDGRGRISDAWTEARVEPDSLLPICSEVFCSFISINISTDGIFYALFGASADPSTTSISQELTIPTSASDLTFDLLVAICDSADDNLVVDIDGTEVYRWDCPAETEDYTAQSADISAFADDGTHTLTFTGATVATNGGNTNIFVDNISIAIPGVAPVVASSCTERDTACGPIPIETFDAGIPAGWSVINLGPDNTDGWGTNGDGTCLAQNADLTAVGSLSDAYYGSNNLTTGTGGVACADSDATGQVDAVAAGTVDNPDPSAALEMDTYLCSPALDLQTITGPSFSFNTNYQSANNQFNDNGTPDDFTDDFDEDLLEVLIGTFPPSVLSIDNYTRLGGVNDHEDGSLVLTGAQELTANLEGTELEGASEGYVCFHYKGTYAWFAQIDNAGLRGEDCALAPVDSDGDGVFDSTDNCTNAINPMQEDSNGDGIGSACDADFNNDCIVNFIDLVQFAPRFNTADGDPLYDPDFDLDSSGSINFIDFLVFPASFGLAPGPSANDCVIGLGN